MSRRIAIIDTEPSNAKVIDVDESDTWPKFIVERGELISDSILTYGSWELNIIRDAIKYVRDNSTFIDIGANMGAWTVTLARLTRERNVDVVCFEPQRDVFYQLCGNIFLNHISDRVECHNVALGSPRQHESYMNMYKLADGGNNGMARLETTEQMGDFTIDHEERTLIRTLDSYMLENVSCIKMDVEGFEEHVLDGAITTIVGNNYPALYFESWGAPEHRERRQKLFEKVRSIGYDTIDLVSGDGDFRATKLN